MPDLTGWSVGDRINAALLLVAVIGIGLTWLQVRYGAKTQRSSFLRDLYATLNNDQAICDAYYAIEYGEFRYGVEFHGSSEERQIDRLLSFMDLVCELHFRGVLTKEEMRFFEYRMRRIMSDEHVQAYFDFLREFYRLNRASAGPFPSFSRYCQTLVEEHETIPGRLIVWFRGILSGDQVGVLATKPLQRGKLVAEKTSQPPE